MNDFRRLRADEIDARVSTIKDKGLTLLLYKDARVDQNILDETFGIFGWKREHQLIGDRLYCTVSIKNPDTGEWISKQDVGTESYTEKEKGQASDSFKRACFNFGIGRELYTAPFIWIEAGNYKTSVGKEGKPTTYDHFSVKSIGYDESGNINSLQIVNDTNKRVVYTMGEKPITNSQEANEKCSTKQAEYCKSLLEKAGKDLKMVCDSYGIQDLSELTKAQAQAIINKFKD